MVKFNNKRCAFGAALGSMAFCVSAPASATNYSQAELLPGGTIVAEAHGDAQTGALYEAGSIGKFACTLAVLRLVDRGVLTLDAPLNELLPDAPGTPIADVTLRQVLQSRSGIADGLLPAFGANPRAVMQTRDAAQAVQLYASGELTGEPGTMWSYDLVNWVTVQAVLEQATGRDIAETLNDLVLRPAGMGQSRIFVGTIGADAQPAASSAPPLPQFLTCAGGLATTPTDLIALARFAHMGGLSAGSLAALTQVSTPEEDYTLGGRFIARAPDDARLISWQTGSNGAYKSLVTYDPVADVAFAATTASGDSSEIQAIRDQWLASQRR